MEGYNVCLPNEHRLALKNVGYSPQHDYGLVDLLTFSEHHELMCAMKGVSPTTEQIENLRGITVRALCINLHSHRNSKSDC